MSNTATITPALSRQQKDELDVREFLIETLEQDLPDGSLQDILKDGTLLCQMIQRYKEDNKLFAENTITLNDGHNKFAYQDNIGQFLRVAENILPQSDLFQTVDLLEGKHMQSVICCLLAIKRKMSGNTKSAASRRPSHQSIFAPLPTKEPDHFHSAQSVKSTKSSIQVNSKERKKSEYENENELKKTKQIPNTSLNNKSTASLEPNNASSSWSRQLNNRRAESLDADMKRKSVVDDPTTTKKPVAAANVNPKRSTGSMDGYVKSQVHMITANNSLTVASAAELVHMSTRRLSSPSECSKILVGDEEPPLIKATQRLPVQLALSKSTPPAPLLPSTSPYKEEEYNRQNNSQEPKKEHYEIPVSVEKKCCNMDYTSRKTSLKKMGTYGAIHIEGGKVVPSATYALGKSIGKGQFGEVFGGLNMETGEYVAIKRIKRNQMDCDDMNEVGVLEKLNNEHIVRYKGFCKDDIYLNIILEYVEMGSLHKNIKSFGKFPEKLAASYTYKILSGLHYLHSSDVIHCDLKAANILTTKTGGLKLTDFGVSLSLKMKDDENTGEPAGTPNWMAPEVIKFAGASPKSDIWSLGCTIVEMLTGKPPYADMPSFAALYRIVEDEEPPIPKNTESEDAKEFLLSCFQKDPRNRPTAYELMHSKWMAPYHEARQKQDMLAPSSFLSLPNQDFGNSSRLKIKKSRSEASIELSDSETVVFIDNSRNPMDDDKNSRIFYKNHDFIVYQTHISGEQCNGCLKQVRRSPVKFCQDCRLIFHPHCLDKALPCSKDCRKTSIDFMNKQSIAIQANENGSHNTRRSIDKRNIPLAPLDFDMVPESKNKKTYLPAYNPAKALPSLPSNQQSATTTTTTTTTTRNYYKTEGYVNKRDPAAIRRSIVSSIMT